MQPDMSGHRFINPGQHAQQRGFARAVGADQAKPLAAVQMKLMSLSARTTTRWCLSCASRPGRCRDQHFLQTAGAAVIQRKQTETSPASIDGVKAHDLDPERDPAARAQEERPGHAAQHRR